MDRLMQSMQGRKLETTVRRLMKRTGCDPITLSHRLGVHHSTIYRWLEGDARPHPSLRRLVLLLEDETARV